MPMWPATLPDYVLQEGYSEQKQSVVIRSEMETGPAKVRRRFTAAVTTFAASQNLSAEQADTLTAFHDVDCYGGSIAFDWVHPRTQQAVSFRFLSPPKITAHGPRYRASYELEILP